MTTTFTWNGIAYTMRNIGNGWEFRNIAHLAGKWFSVDAAINNKERLPSFRKAMSDALAAAKAR